MPDFPRLILKPGEGRRAERGHLWVFSNEVASLEETHGSDEVSVFSAKGRHLGNALLSSSSLIRARIYSREPVSFDGVYIASRLESALQYRRDIGYERQSFRWCHSEADFLPGLVVDVYGNHAVMQISAKATDDRRETIKEIIYKIRQPACIYERSDVPLRELENLPPVCGLRTGELQSPILIEENGISILADIAHGQKTGYFLDMYENRSRLLPLFKRRRVLDLFCYSGAWALTAARHGAESALGVDSSASAIHLAHEASKINHLGAKCRFIENDAFEFLKTAYQKNEQYDFIIVDPPPFARRKKDVGNALRAYRDVNCRAIKILSPGGILATASCSHNILPDDLLQCVRLGARDAHADLRLFFMGAQSPDHPIHHATPESAYLKFFAFMRV